AAEGAVAAVVAGEVARWAVGSCTTGPYRIGVAVARRHGDDLGGVLATTPAAPSSRSGCAAASAAAPALHLHRGDTGGGSPCTGAGGVDHRVRHAQAGRSEEHTSELQSREK